MAKDFLSELNEQFKPRTIDTARQNLSIAEQSGYEPAARGKMIEAGRRLGLSPEAIENLPKLQIDQLDRRKQRMNALRQSIAVQEFVAANPNNAIVGYRDIERLTKIDTMAKRMRQYAKVEPSILEKLSNSVTALPTGIADGLGGINRSVFGLVQFSRELGKKTEDLIGVDLTPAINPAAGLADMLAGEENVDDFIQHNISVSKELPASLYVTIGNQDWETADGIVRDIKQKQFHPLGVGVTDIASAGTQLAPTIVGGGAGLGIKGLAVIAGLQSFGGTFAEKSASSHTFAERSGLATLSGTITGLLTRYIPGGSEHAAQFLGRMSTDAAKRFIGRSLAVNIGKEASLEFVEEYADEFLQGVLVNGLSFEEATNQALMAGKIGALLGGGLNVAPAIYATREARANEAKNLQQSLEDLKSEVDKTEMANIAPASMKEFLQSNAHAPKELYADAAELAELMAADEDARSQLEKAGVTETRLDDAARTGETVAIATAGIITDLTEPVIAKVQPLLRKSPEGMSIEEANEFGADEDVEQALDAEAALSQEQKDFDVEASRLMREAAIAHRENPASPDAKAKAMPLIQGAWAFYSRHKNYYQSINAAPADFLKRVSIKFKQDGAVVKPPSEIFPAGAPIEPEAFIMAQPKYMRADLRKELASVKEQASKAGVEVMPADVVELLNTSANMMWGGRNATVGLDSRSKVLRQDQPVGREVLDDAPDGWQDIQVEIETADGASETIAAGDAAKQLARREKAAEGLITCLSK